MSTQKKFFSLRIQPETYEAMRMLAFKHRRSIAAEMELALQVYIAESDLDMEESLPAAAHNDGYGTDPVELERLHRQLLKKYGRRK